MKAIFKYMLITLAAVVATAALTACGDDDDDPLENTSIVGKWTGSDYDHFFHNVTITFNSNGTGTATIDHGYGSGYTSRSYAEFTYKLKKNKVTTKGVLTKANSGGDVDTMDFNMTFELSGNTLYVVDGNSWYKSNVNSFTK